MKERPILFSAPMVRAILEGKKSQTRRIVRGAPADWNPVMLSWYAPIRIDRYGDEEPGPERFGTGNEDGSDWITCPYYVGDRLWVRETWGELLIGFMETEEKYLKTVFRADHPGIDTDFLVGDGWRPSIHMPRWASRITLEVTDVRVQRLQYISEDDAIAEGIWECESGFWWYAPESQVSLHRDTLTPEGRKRGAVDAFTALWDSINGKRPGCAWKDNPFVWAISFRRLEATK